MSITGFPDGPPTRSGQSISDYYAGMLCAFSIVSALHYRDRTGKGQHIDMALLDSLVVALDNLGERYTVGGEVLTRAGNVSFGGSSSGRLSDDGRPRGHRRGREQRGVAAVLRRSSAADDLTRDPEFATAPARRDRRDAIAAIIQAWTGDAAEGGGRAHPRRGRRPGRAGQQRGRDGRRSPGAGPRDVRRARPPVYGPLKTDRHAAQDVGDARPGPLARARCPGSTTRRSSSACSATRTRSSSAGAPRA